MTKSYWKLGKTVDKDKKVNKFRMKGSKRSQRLVSKRGSNIPLNRTFFSQRRTIQAAGGQLCWAGDGRRSHLLFRLDPLLIRVERNSTTHCFYRHDFTTFQPSVLSSRQKCERQKIQYHYDMRVCLKSRPFLKANWGATIDPNRAAPDANPEPVDRHLVG